LRECATQKIRATEVSTSFFARKFETEENTMKYIKPEVTGTFAASTSIQASVSKGGQHFDGNELSTAAYQADE